jgi:hypothetical protein
MREDGQNQLKTSAPLPLSLSIYTTLSHINLAGLSLYRDRRIRFVGPVRIIVGITKNFMLVTKLFALLLFCTAFTIIDAVKQKSSTTTTLGDSCLMSDSPKSHKLNGFFFSTWRRAFSKISNNATRESTEQSANLLYLDNYTPPGSISYDIYI